VGNACYDVTVAEAETVGGAHPTEEAEACFLKVIEIARQRRAKSWELRAATSLARLWQQQGKKAEARRCSQKSTAGSPKGLTQEICKRPRRCCKSCTEADEHYARAWRCLILFAFMVIASPPSTGRGQHFVDLVVPLYFHERDCQVGASLPGML